MKKILKRGLSLVLTLIMVAGMLPLTAFAAVDSSGRPTDLKNKLVLSIYTTEGTFPGEPATHGSSEYISFKSDFTTTSASGQFKSSAEDELDPSILGENVLVQGTGNSSTKVWGVFSAEGLDQYFLKNASIIQPENEKKIIQEVKNCSAEDADQYEIIWYVIKLQHSPSSWWWSNGTTEWHIDGLIKEKQYVSINYYGNGNTSGAAPDGITNHTAGKPYTILGKNTMVKKINGVEVAFLGWSARADGTGAEAGFYQPGDVIEPEESISLYAMWDTTTQYTATVNTYLDGVLTSDSAIHGTERKLALGTTGDDGKMHYYDLTEGSAGVYTVKITGNGKFHLYNKSGDAYTKIGDRQLTIYNQNGSMDVHHYSVTYKSDDDTFATQNSVYGDTVTAITNVPTKDGHRFLGWEDNTGKLIQPGGAVTASVTAPIILTAKWEETVKVTVNVIINHNEPNGGCDNVATKRDVVLDLVSRENENSPYLEVEGKTLKLPESARNGFTVTQTDEQTKYTGYVFADMAGGDVDYTVVTSKSGYDTEITPTQDDDGNWTIDVVMDYKPSNFDVKFTVEMADENMPRPKAAIVKVTYWSKVQGKWMIITQQDGNLPGVRVDLNANGEGSGSYPVWKYESDSTVPYGYRAVVTSFVYPDGTIVPVSDVTNDKEWTDRVYTATLQNVTDGGSYGNDGNKLGGAYYDEGTDSQKGTLNIVIARNQYDVTFDAQGGKVNDKDSQTVENQYVIPGFEGYVPTREGYKFDGWYADKDCTVPATAGADLSNNITLYAKWIELLTIKGDINILGTYPLNGQDVPVNEIDRATEAVVVLQEIRDGKFYDVDSQTAEFTYGEDKNGTGTYSFSGIPKDGKEYRIHLLLLNYTTKYENESDSDEKYDDDEYTAVFDSDSEAVVNAELTFVPPSYDQDMIVDAKAIGEGYRPNSVLAKVLYRDVGDNHPFNVISQHGDNSPAPHGVVITLKTAGDDAGTGTGSESIWKWHTNGTLYAYQMNITKVDNEAYNSDTAPFYIVYDVPAYWNSDTDSPSGDLVATLIPKKYLVTYDLNADGDVVTGVDKLTYQDEEGNTVVADTYGVVHTWSFDTAITAAPEREGYRFLGWEADVAGAYTDGKIGADVQQEVTLIAQWEQITYEVTTVADLEAGGTVSGAGTFEHGTQVTVVATPSEGYNFLGWYENGEQVSTDLSYSFEIRDNRDFTAKFSLNKHTVNTVADPSEGGTTSGGGIFDYGASATVSATAEPGYTFAGWYENGELVSSDAEYTFTVSTNHKLTAHFSENTSYTITANTTDGGTATGGGSYKEGTTATLTAEPKATHKFLGWFENGELVCADEVYSFVVTENRTLKASFGRAVTVTTVASPEGVGELTGGGMYASGATVTLAATANNGYCFVGWYDEAGNLLDGDTLTVWEDITLTAKFVEKKTYRSDSVYLFGYNNSKIGAEGPLLRGELAQMIYRLVRENGTPRTNGKVFADTQGQWFQSGMSYMAQVGAIDSTQENANPYAAVSRGETYKMICLGLRLTDDTSLRFSQYAAILRSHSYKVPEGTPTGNIARWQFCALFNDILGRSGHSLIDLQGNKVTHETYQYTDLDPNASYYNTMLIATSSFKEGKVDVEGRIDRNKYDYTDPN